VVVDFDDFSEASNRLDLLERLRVINPRFRCTVFAIPALGTEDFWRGTPDWIELAVHGWEHPHPREAEDWTLEQAGFVMDHCAELFEHGFKAPGWQISDATYVAARERGWWIADHWDNDHRRPAGQLTHVISRAAGAGEDPNHWHGHIPNECGNGIAETFDRLAMRVELAEHFELISEVVTPYDPNP